MSDLASEVKEFAIKQGAHLVGIAPVERFEGAPKGHHPTDLLPGARSVVSIAMRFYQSTLRSHTFGLESELIPKEQLRRLQNEIYSFMYDTDNRGLEWIAVQIAYFLTERGYQALPMPASGSVARYVDETGRMRWRAFLSHRHAAVLAGLGDIGVNNLLITPQYGPRVRVNSVITTAELTLDPSFPSRRYGIFSHRHAAVLAGLGDMGMNNLLITPRYGPRVRLNSVITTAELTPDPMLEERVCLGEECMLCLRSKPCWGEAYDFELGGKVFQLARFMGCKPGLGPEDGDRAELCWRGGWGTLPYLRYCIGSCPVGKDSG